MTYEERIVTRMMEEGKRLHGEALEVAIEMALRAMEENEQK